jgi:hypothetical protein
MACPCGHLAGRPKPAHKVEKNLCFGVAKSWVQAFNERLSPPLKENVMPKTLTLAAFAAAMALSPAYSASDLCTDAHMKQMDQMIAEMTDAAAKKEATMHLDISKAEMKKGNEAGCVAHMEEAHKAMGM